MDLVTVSKNLPKQYSSMLQNITSYLPVIEKASRNYNKSQSQFMNNMLTLSQPTEIRSLRQILAEVTNSKQALANSYFTLAKKKIKIKKLERKLEIEEDDLERELIQLQIGEVNTQIETTLGYVEGAVRRIAGYISQYQSILKYIGKEEITEEDFEKDEERYHIMKAFEQGLCAARAHNGTIDEGNHIYFYQIGISGTTAQSEVTKFLEEEGRMLANGTEPSHENTWDWIHRMSRKFEGCSQKFAENKGMILLDETSLHSRSINNEN